MLKNSKETAASRSFPWDLLFVVVAGFVPLFWFSDGMVLKSVDLRLPYSLTQWNGLFSIWNHDINTGAETILDNCLIPFMALPALLQKIGFPLITTQKIIFVFWFMLPGFAMAYLMRSLFDGKSALLFRLCGISFYMFNLWLEHVWIGFKPPILSAYVFIPFMLGVVLRTVRGQMSRLRGLSLFVILSFLSSGMGNNSSEFGASFAPVIFILFYLFISAKTWRNPALFKHFLKLALGFILAWLAGSLYWLIPQMAAIWRTIVLKMTGEVVPLSDLLLWLQGISISCSFFNVVRIQADWTWYQGCVDPYRTYSTLYHQSPFFFALSLTLPAIVLIGLFKKQIRGKGFFLTLLFLGLFLSMGSHPPFGFIYLWLTQHIPLFWIFRSPYLKFFFWDCLAYAVFFGAGCVLISEWISRLLNWGKGKVYSAEKPLVSALVGILFCAFNVVYAMPISTGKLFTKPEERTFLSPERFQIPNHVFQAAKWVDNQKGFFRLFSLPGDNPSIYTWGGVNFGSFIREFSSKPLVFAYDAQWSLVAQGSVNQSQELAQLVRKQIYEERTPWAADILALLNVRYLLQENDIRYDFYKGHTFVEGDSPQFISGKIGKQNGFISSEKFGDWKFYRVQKELPYIYGAPAAVQIRGPLDLFTWLTYQPFPSRPAFFFSPSHDFSKEIPESPEVVSVPVSDGIYSYPSSPGGKLVVATTQMKSRIDLGNAVNRALQKELVVDLHYTAFNEPEMRGGKTWMWWAGNLDDIGLTNKSGEAKFPSFYAKVNSLEIDRSFFVNCDTTLLGTPPTPHDQDTDILIKEIAVAPGEHKITFYCPTRNSPRQGKGMSFSIEKESLAIGMLTFEMPFQLVDEGKYTLTVYPQLSQPLKKKIKTLSVDEKLISLDAKHTERKDYYRTSLKLEKGKHVLKLDQENGENYFVELAQEDPEILSASEPKIDIVTRRATRHQIHVSASSPFFLVFNESYHPMWRVYSLEGNKKRFFTAHAKVNGFANGYYVDKTGDFDLILEFTPQRLFRYCLILTGFFLLSAFLGLGISFLRRRRD